MKPVRVTVNDKMQKGYVYLRTRPIGRDFRPGFKPQLTPTEMLKLGVFGGKYMTDCSREFPASWFKNAKLCAKRHGRAHGAGADRHLGRELRRRPNQDAICREQRSVYLVTDS